MPGEVTYGPGGYDPDHPTGNVTERTIDRGDGTGVREEWTGKSWSVVGEVDFPRPPPLEGIALLATIQLVKGEIDEATAEKIAGRPVEDLAREAEAWAVAAEIEGSEGLGPKR